MSKTIFGDVQELIDQGYRCISRKYGTVARVDRVDWIPFLASQLRIPIESLSALYREGKNQSNDYADYYRRVHSKDTLALGPTLGAQFPTSSWDPIGYVPKAGEKAEVEVETTVYSNIIEQVTTIGECAARTVLDVRDVHVRKALHKLGWRQVRNPQLSKGPKSYKLELKLHDWFSKRFTGKYFTLRLMEREQYLHACARELGKALRALMEKGG